jgi:hypothetical protein
VMFGCVVAGCGNRESSLLQSYAKGTLTPGQGLNDIHIGDPIKSFLERFGSGRVSVLAGDELLAADLHFPSQGLSFRFTADSACQSAVRAGGSTVRSMMGLRDAKRFLRDFPACGSMSLHSIGVEDGGGTFGPAFAGQTAKGSKLHMTRAELLEHDGPGALDPYQKVSSVLETADDRQFEQFVFADGLIAYVQREGENNREPAAAQWKVVKMAVVSEIK